MSNDTVYTDEATVAQLTRRDVVAARFHPQVFAGKMTMEEALAKADELLSAPSGEGR